MICTILFLIDTVIHSITVYCIIPAPNKWWLDIESGHKFEVFESKPSQHHTLVFNAFAFMTLFNEINARKMHDEHYVFDGIYRNYVFLIVWFASFAAQVR